jgi:hypothetical protein
MNKKLDGHFGKEKFFCPYQDLKPGLPSMLPSHYTQYANKKILLGIKFVSHFLQLWLKPLVA